MAGRSTLAKGLTALAVVLAVIGSVTAWILSYQGYLPGDAVVRSWAAPKDRAGDGRPNGTWIAGDVAVRSRYDAVTGFGIGEGQDGRKLWEFVPPGRTRICGSARHADASVLLVAYGQEGGATRGKGCAAVLALDTKDGRELWTAPRTVADGGPEQEEPFLDAGSGLAVIGHHSRSGGDRTSLRALDLRTGKPRWTAAIPDGCGPRTFSVGGEQVVAVLGCGAGKPGDDGFGETGELTAAAFDLGSGALKWNVPLDARRPVGLSAAADIVSADPPVLSVGRSGVSDEGVAFFSFGGDGKPRPVIESEGVGTSVPARAAVAGDRLYALEGFWQKGQRHRLAAFDLTTGEKVWRTTLDDPAAALSLRGDRITVLGEWTTQSTDITDLLAFDTADGEEVDFRSFRDEVPHDIGAVYQHHGRIIVAGSGGGSTFTAYERW
ncbi:PQQ-binding-like beta-propeller repeat protein [Streptomyces zhihengii]|uniref:PQQ-binding-like beta-propeller repeat protein n=1 Tax=Streptomyces zhihengii TaxID=1818004 RepID=A0ABS2UWD0_9ACTN|nr:PQQ-binding-like beta-propeller repeat protein [Streptomyces zhihengii]MBM9621760.1 PQQ-binding-like beta-propeller repeat protein [Streptomyces zhihengii]